MPDSHSLLSKWLSEFKNAHFQTRKTNFEALQPVCIRNNAQKCNSGQFMIMVNRNPPQIGHTFQNGWFPTHCLVQDVLLLVLKLLKHAKVENRVKQWFRRSSAPWEDCNDDGYQSLQNLPLLKVLCIQITVAGILISLVPLIRCCFAPIPAVDSPNASPILSALAIWAASKQQSRALIAS